MQFLNTERNKTFLIPNFNNLSKSQVIIHLLLSFAEMIYFLYLCRKNTMEQKTVLNFVDQDGQSTNMSLEDMLEDIIRNISSAPSNSETQSKKFDEEILNPEYENVLSEEEKSVVRDVLTTHSELYNTDCHIKNKKRIRLWNKIVKRMPKCTKNLVYRYLNPHDKMDMKKGDIFMLRHCLTTTRIGRGFMPSSQWVGKYIIRCKPVNTTSAHDISLLWSPKYSILKGEEQINFEVGATFYVDAIKTIHDKKFIYMHEI